MADRETAVYTAQQDAASNLAKKADSNVMARRLYHRRVRYPLMGTETTSDIIEVMKLPAGAIVLPELCSVVCDDPGTTLTGTLGFRNATLTADPDAYSSAMTLSAGGVVRCTPTVFDNIEHDTGCDITFTPASADTLTAGADLWFSIAFTLKG